MTDRLRVVRRRAVLAGTLAVLAVGRAARAQPGVAAPASPAARGAITPEARGPLAPAAREAIEMLRLARALLCPRCNDDTERWGVSRPSRRSLNGSAWMENARDVIAATPGLPGAVPALRLLRYGIEVLESYSEDQATWAIDAAIVALQAEARVAAGAPPDPRALMGQLRLTRRFLCPRCVGAESEHERRPCTRATEELVVAREMLAAAPRLPHAEQVAARLGVAQEALAASDDPRADAALAWAIERLRPVPRAAR